LSAAWRFNAHERLQPSSKRSGRLTPQPWKPRTGPITLVWRWRTSPACWTGRRHGL